MDGFMLVYIYCPSMRILFNRMALSAMQLSVNQYKRFRYSVILVGLPGVILYLMPVETKVTISGY